MIVVIFLMSGNVSATTIEVTDETTGTKTISGREIPTYKVNVYDSNGAKIGTYDVTRDAFGADSYPGDPCNPLPLGERYGTNHECPLGNFHGSRNPNEGRTHWIQIGSTPGSSTIKAEDNPSGVERTGINFHGVGTTSRGCMGIVPDTMYNDFRTKVNDNGDLDSGDVTVNIEDRYTQTGDGIKRCCTTSDGKSGCQTCSGGSWGTCGACPEDQWCEEGECVPEASTCVLFAAGLLCLAGYIGLKRRKTK